MTNLQNLDKLDVVLACVILFNATVVLASLIREIVAEWQKKEDED
jgi:hypothetical protein